MRTTLLSSAADSWPLRLASDLADRGDHVTLVLLDRSADMARLDHPAAAELSDAHAHGADVLVDAEALQRRGITPTAIADGIKPTDLMAVADLLVDATDKVVWL